MKDCGLRGLDLLDAVIAQIEAHPETWNQRSYRCGTGMCVAGWACELTGGEWLFGPDHDYGDCLMPVSDDDPAHVQEAFEDIPAHVDATDRACRLLTGGDGDAGLFYSDNTLPRIKAIRDALRAEEAVMAGDSS